MIKETITDKLNLKMRVENAVNFLSPKFGVKIDKLKYPEISIVELPQEVYAKYGNSALEFDTKKFLRDSKNGPLTFIVLDLIVGEEVGHFVHKGINPEIYTKTLPEYNRFRRLAIEIIGHYSALIYANGNMDWIVCLGAKASDPTVNRAYRIADALYFIYRDSKLLELANLVSVIEINTRLKELII